MIDLAGKVVMPGGIDLHSHIGGGKVNIARMMLPEEHRAHLQHRHGACRSGSGHASPSTFTTGYAYARMGYTMAFEPAMLPVNARQAHQEMADVPLLDKGAYALLGNDDLFLQPGQGRRRPGRDPRLRRLDAARHAGAGDQDRQPRRDQRLQVQRPQARPRPGGPVLRHHAAHHPDHAGRRA